MDSAEKLFDRLEFALGERSDLAAKCIELQNIVSTLEYQLQQAKEENDVVLKHLYKAQEEMERYFLLSHKQAEMLSLSNELNQRSIAMLANANP